MKKSLVYLTLVLSTLFWGANFNLGKYVVHAMDPLAAAAWRFIAAGAVMAAYTFYKEGIDWAGMRRNLAPLVVMALLGIFGFNVAFFYGLQTTSSVDGSLIMTLNPTITVVLTALVIGDRISWRQVLGLALSFTGVVTVVTGGAWSMLAHFTLGRGNGLILLGNLCWAVYSIVGKRFIRQLSALQTTTATMLIGGAAITGLAMATHGGTLPVPAAPNVAALAVMALFGSVMAYLWWNNGIRTIGPARTAVFFDLVPIFTMVIAISLGEHVTLAQGLGAVFVIGGVLFSSGALDRPAAPARTRLAPSGGQRTC